MKLSRLLLLCFLLTGTSVIAGPFEDYLTTNDNPAPNDSNYALLSKGRELVTQHATKVDGYLRLGAANLLTESAINLVEKAEIEGKEDKTAKDKHLAHKVIDRLTAATNLVSGEGVRVSGKGTAATNACYVRLAFLKAANLKERSPVVAEEKIEHQRVNTLNILQSEFNYRGTGNPEEDQEQTLEASPLEKLRFQMHALTYVIFNALNERAVEEAFRDINTRYGKLTQTLEGLKGFVNPYLKAYLKSYNRKDSPLRTNMGIIFSTDSQQHYFEIDKGIMRSLPRILFFSTTKEELSPQVLIQNIRMATLAAKFSDKSSEGKIAIQEVLQSTDLALSKPEEIQSALVVAAISRQTTPKDMPADPATIGHDILTVMDHYVTLVNPHVGIGPIQWSAITDIFMRKEGAVLYKQAKPHEGDLLITSPWVLVNNKVVISS